MNSLMDGQSDNNGNRPKKLATSLCERRQKDTLINKWKKKTALQK